MAGTVTLPALPQEIFDEVVRTRRIPWIPDSPEARELSWFQLARENWVPMENAWLVNTLQRILHGAPDLIDERLRRLARANNLRFPECTP